MLINYIENDIRLRALETKQNMNNSRQSFNTYHILYSINTYNVDSSKYMSVLYIQLYNNL